MTPFDQKQLEKFREKFGSLILQDRSCGNMPYSELAGWKDIEVGVFQVLKAQRKEFREEIEKLRDRESARANEGRARFYNAFPDDLLSSKILKEDE